MDEHSAMQHMPMHYRAMPYPNAHIQPNIAAHGAFQQPSIHAHHHALSSHHNQLPYQHQQQIHQHQRQLHHQQQQQIEVFWANQMQEIEQAVDFRNHSLPLARIKKIMKSDDENVRMISAEAPVFFAKACEMFINELTLRAWIHTEENKRQTLQMNDIAAAIARTDIFDFQIDIIPRDELKEDQERTGHIIFKLFGQHPSNFPVTLRAQILEWLSHNPSDMESYIRPGCVILSIFVSMPSASWERLREDLPQRLKLLVEDSRTDFWRSGRVLVQAEQRLASSNDGKVRFCSSWRSWDAPEIYFVQPIAVVAGQETTITLRGHNLTTSGTKILCAYKGKYTSTDVLPEEKTSISYSEIIPTDHRMQKFTFSGGPPNVLGRCFIEVEHGFKSNCFPVIVVDPTIYRELQNLEPEIENEFSNILSQHWRL